MNCSGFSIRIFLLHSRLCQVLGLAAACLAVSQLNPGFAAEPAGKTRVIIDADTANEIDDLFAALLLDPTIADKVTFAFIDGDFREGKWGPGIYNWKNDIHAVKAIFESPVEYFHMPAPTVSGDLVMTREEAKRHLTGRGPLWDFLIEYWEAHPYYKKHSDNRMWDLALVQAFLRPPLAERQITGAPIIHNVSRVEQFPDNPRQVTVFTRIDVPGMLADFWEAAQTKAASQP